MAAFLVLSVSTPAGWCADVSGRGPLHLLPSERVLSILPPDTRLLLDPTSIERFLEEVDGNPPDWPAIYGHGHHDPTFDDRLFALNRDRDQKRVGHAALSRRITFAWPGELSSFQPDLGGYSVSIGPRLTETSWGIVRFRPEEAPGNLVVVADAPTRTALQRELGQGRRVEIEVLMTGRLVPDESLVYDFSHDQEGRGLIMPFVRVEQVDFLKVTLRTTN
jgi:hypothetical protein